jgi:2-keto-4-pentenoate hydratase/2-oxohepta-3-ene-1,7-dioic acid hydratase in catechol pathway
MRLVTYRSQVGPRVAAAYGEGFVDLHDADSGLPTTLKELLAQGPEGLQRAARAASRGRPIPAAGVHLLAPVLDPEKVLCIGLNYADHAAETGQPLPSEPVVFNKFPTAIIGPEQPIVIPRVSRKVDYEAELVVVIGRGGRHIPRQRAWDHVAGYTCGHDVSARDWQLEKSGGQWLLGKSFDTFAPMGPVLVTPDEIGDPGALGVSLRLNGQTMQESSTRQLIFTIDQLVAYISDVCTLQVGDVIYTGTPPGVGVARKPPLFLKPGDTVEVEVENIGILRNPVVAE